MDGKPKDTKENMKLCIFFPALPPSDSNLSRWQKFHLMFDKLLNFDMEMNICHLNMISFKSYVGPLDYSDSVGSDNGLGRMSADKNGE